MLDHLTIMGLFSCTAATHPGHSADVVLVRMRDDHRLNLVTPLVQEGCVWQNLLHAVVCEAASQTGYIRDADIAYSSGLH